MLIKYLLDYPKLDSINGCGLRWEAGQIRNVSPEMAERLLVYTDTWAKADEATDAPTNADEATLTPIEKPMEEPIPVIDFLAMDKKALIEFAQTKYNEKMDKRWSETTIRHHVIGLFSQHEMDAG